MKSSSQSPPGNRLGEALSALRLHVTTAESCTGGGIAAAITEVPGSSGYFGAGFVTYSNAAKRQFLGVSDELLQSAGAVSEPVVQAMVAGALERSGADLGVAVSGIAGPGGGTADKPPGTVWLAWQRAGAPVKTQCAHFHGDRHSVRRQTVRRALEGLLELLQEDG